MSDPTKNQLRRALGSRVAMAIVVGNVIGSGIFVKPGAIAAASGSFPLILSAWIAGGVLCLLGALCFAELATMMPSAGGPYVYLHRAYGRLPAFLFGWTEFLFMRPASIGALATISVGSLMNAAHIKASPWAQVFVACLLIAGMAWINIIGVVWGGRFQLGITVVKAAFVLLVALSPFALWPWADTPTFALQNYRSVPSPTSLSWMAQLAAVMVAVMWAYDGWHGVTPLAEEIENPQRNIPIGLIGGMAVLIALYVGANLAYHGALTHAELVASQDHAAEAMLLKIAGPTAQSMVSVMILFSVFGAINSNMLLAPRILFAMGRDGLFFRSLGQVHAKYRTPTLAIVTTAAMAMTLIVAIAAGRRSVAGYDPAVMGRVSRAVVTSLQQQTTFDLLTVLVVFSAGVFFVACAASVFVLRWKEPGAERPYKTWGYPVVPLVFLLGYIAFLTQAWTAHPVESAVGIGGIMLGVPVYLFMRRTDAKLE